MESVGVFQHKNTLMTGLGKFHKTNDQTGPVHLHVSFLEDAQDSEPQATVKSTTKHRLVQIPLLTCGRRCLLSSEALCGVEH